MKKLILILTLAALAPLHADTLIYTIRSGTANTPKERTVTLTPGTVLVISGSGTIETQASVDLPLNTATQTALDLKLDKAGGTTTDLTLGGLTQMSGTMAAPTVTVISGTTTRRFSTIGAAQAAAVSGDLIAVDPGTYAEAINCVNGVNWYFYPGAVVAPSIETTPYAMNIGNGVSAVIGGYGVFTFTENDVMDSTSTIFMSGSGNVCFTAESVLNPSDSTANDNWTLRITDSKNTWIKLHKELTNHGDAGLTYSAVTGTHYFECPYIDPGFYHSIWTQTSSTNAVININSDVIGGRILLDSSSAVGQVYINANKSQRVTTIGPTIANTTLNIRSISEPSTEPAIFTDGVTSGTITVNGGRLTTLGGNSVGGNAGSTVVLNGCTLDQPVAAGPTILGTYTVAGAPRSGTNVIYSGTDTTFTDNTIPRTDGTTGLLQKSAVGLDDGNNISTNGQISAADFFSANRIGWSSSSRMKAPSDGRITLYNAALTDFEVLQFGGVGSGFPALKRTGGSLDVMAADLSSYTGIQAFAFTARGGSTAGLRLNDTNNTNYATVYLDEDVAGNSGRLQLRLGNSPRILTLGGDLYTTKSGTAVMVEDQIIKSVQTIETVTNSSTLTDSTALQATLTTGTWAVTTYSLVSSGTGYAAQGTKESITFTGTATYSGILLRGGASNAEPINVAPSWGGVAQSMNSAASFPTQSGIFERRGLVIVTSPGTLKVQFAGAAAVPDNTVTLNIGSTIRATRLP